MIEDVEYLKDNCEHDSVVVYIDSDARNRDYFPFPAEYTISFDNPFKLVVGFDVLDASIPSTMWNVDRYNGTLAITLLSLPITNSLTIKDVEVYYKELQYVSSFARLFERAHKINELNENVVLIVNGESIDSQGIVFEENDELTEYFVYVRRDIETELIVAPPNLEVSEYYTVVSDGVMYYIDYQETDTISILEQNNFRIYTWYNPLNPLLSKIKMIYYEEINVSKAVYLSLKNTRSYLCMAHNMYKQIPLGNYTITTLKSELNALWTPYGVEFETTVAPDSKQGIYEIRSTSGIVIVNAALGRLIKQLGFDTYPRSDERDRYDTCIIGTNKFIFSGNFIEDYGGYKVKAPGIVNLFGDRFLILRCKEIEDHLLGSYSYTRFSPGLGLFKMASSYNNVNHLRFDFVNLVRKPFHPIGKLSKLSFRFETQEGNLYDFKGVNHQMLLVLKFLVPTQKKRLQKSVLNPNYNPNFIQYMSTSANIQQHEDSDKEEDYNTKHNRVIYNKQLLEYEYSTSGSEADASGEDTEQSEIEFDFSRRPLKS